MKSKTAYKCLKCNHTAFQSLKDFSRQYNTCRQTESATSNILFHKVKFGVRKAFFISFKMPTITKSLSASYMGVRYGVTEKATRYYISNLKDEACVFQNSIRSHWAIENKLLWTLDVAFSEDASRKRNQNTAQNYSILLKTALNLLKNEKTEKQGGIINIY